MSGIAVVKLYMQ